jgi:hypothetical protein
VIAPATPAPPTDALHTVFLSILPRIILHGEVVFRRVRCPHRKEEYLAEMTALCWRWLVRLARQGKDATRFVSALATFAARQVWSGRRLCGQERAKDAMSGRAQRRRGFRIEPLPASTRRPFDDFYGSVHGQQELDAFEERLRDNTQTPVPEQVSFRLDFPCWLRTRTSRDRKLINDMLQDERTLDLAKKHRLSAGRVSQLRREFMASWERFCGEEECLPAPAKA